MVEYLKKYKKLLELQKTNQKEIKEIELIINETNQKWAEEKEKESNVEAEIKELNKKYNEKMEAKEKKFFDKLTLFFFIMSMISIIVSSIFNPIWLLLSPPLVCAASGIIYLMTFIISKTTSIFENQFEKDKKIINILEQIKTKEKELSNVKELINEYVKKVIQCRSKLKKLQEKENWYDESINELMRNYAQPIFEEQLKNYQEEVEAKNDEQPKRKSRKQ